MLRFSVFSSFWKVKRLGLKPSLPYSFSLNNPQRPVEHQPRLALPDIASSAAALHGKPLQPAFNGPASRSHAAVPNIQHRARLLGSSIDPHK